MYDVGRAEGGPASLRAVREQRRQLVGAVDDAHAAPAAAGAGLDDDRVADVLAPGQGLLRRLQHPVAAGHQRHARLACMVALACALLPIMRMISALGPMKMMPQASQTSAKSAFSLRKP